MFFAVFLVFAWRRLWEWAWGYENGLTGFCNLVKSMVLADLSIKIGEIVFRTFVYFLELF